ncbi:PREDICTED: olfactory receptor 52A5-like [Ceratotherium simum simum]|uniref:Olfactory receptor 52A5-like n=1 Tax=Ceratotherium simum simum TaxID=73337 RepID=A0ABM0HTZ3_CERSS|nr:PREDICTED: olfactory receptor 52A5-like [Ceratotherium simum simum]
MKKEQKSKTQKHRGSQPPGRILPAGNQLELLLTIIDLEQQCSWLSRAESQHEVTSHVEEQENLAHSEEQYKSPEINPKESEGIEDKTGLSLLDSTDQITLLRFNGSVFMSSVLTLIEIPGPESVQCWIGIPFCIMYLVAVIGNSLILIIIKYENSLHNPMYIFLAILGATDIALSTCILPKMLGLFWFRLPEISFEACLLQMWLIHSFQGIEAGVLLAIALDRYVAICDPLRHATIFSQQLFMYVGGGVTFRSAILLAPSVLLIKCLLILYRRTIVSHSYCEHTAIVKLATEDIWINKIYGLFVVFAILGFDIIFIILSCVQIFITVFRLPQKEARFKALNTCIADICVFLQFYLLAFFSFFTHRFGSHIPPYVHILLANIYLLVRHFLNPIVYDMKTKQIPDHVLKMFFSKKKS